MASGHNFSNYSLIIGRFQPIHKGHMEVIKKCAAESDHITIGIGSAQYSHERNNPFTAGERYLMIDESLREEGISNYFIVPIEDLNRYSLWVYQVKTMSPPFSKVYSNNPLTRRLFSEAGYAVKDSPLYNRELYSGTAVREKMAADGDWRGLVPSAAARIIDEISGAERLKEISGTD
ncbi:MAG: nicotinamide-nucleotide adenylyltransferase [Candidatus Methanoplasma sp.]|jgi:nicotinamide-nucleotide adenylyltransferase|nr:nicotinamide-nucleotide adenylyltransferase [Candidatus Methanoplasma sp.]